MSRKTKDIIMIIVLALGMGFLFWFLSIGRITLLAFPFLMIAFAVSIVLVFQSDRIKRLIFVSKLLKGMLGLRLDLEKLEKAVEPVKDLEIHVEERFIVGDKGRVDVTVKPAVLKLQTIVNDVEVLVDKIEKELSGEINAKSYVRGELTVEKKKEKK